MPPLLPPPELPEPVVSEVVPVRVVADPPLMPPKDPPCVVVDPPPRELKEPVLEPLVFVADPVQAGTNHVSTQVHPQVSVLRVFLSIEDSVQKV